MRALAIMALMAPGFAPMAAAAQEWTPPEGCEGFLTVQQRGCMMSNHYTCEGDPEGHQWRVDFIEDGPVFASRINEETEWVESLSLFSQTRTTLGETPDPANFTELLETGIDTYDFTTVDQDGIETRYRGADVLTGEEVEISGVPLQVMTYTAEVDGPEGRSRSEGVNYVSEEWRLFLPGTSTTIAEDGTAGEERDNTPVQLIQPGEPGFFADTPIYDCGVSDASFVQE